MNFEATITSIPMDEEEKAKWMRPEDTCPRCGEEFGPGLYGKKQFKLDDGTIIHKRCAEKHEQI